MELRLLETRELLCGCHTPGVTREEAGGPMWLRRQADCLGLVVEFCGVLAGLRVFCGNIREAIKSVDMRLEKRIWHNTPLKKLYIIVLGLRPDTLHLT